MNIIKKCANNFNKLLDIEYKIILGKKGKITTLYLHFDKAAFYHLIGFHKIKDIPQLKTNRSLIFDNILNSDLSDKIFKSKNYKDITSRVDAFSKFIKYLDSENMIFKYNKFSDSRYSKIHFDYLIVNNELDKKVFTFLRKESNAHTIIPISFFPEGEADYSKGQITLTLLYKEKIYKNKNTSKVLYCHKNFPIDN